MQPNEPTQLPPPPSPQPTVQPGASYLDQIAAPTVQKTVSPFVLWGAIGGVLLLVGVVLMMILGSGGPTYGQKLNSLVGRLTNIQSTAKKNEKNLRSSQLRSINASLQSAVTNSLRESEKPVAASGEKKKESKKEDPVTAEFKKVTDTLENARLNNTLDSVYAREMTYQIAKTRSEMKALKAQSGSKSLHEFVDSTDKNLAPLYTEFKEFTSSKD
jgi:hypothetical protein